LPETSWPSVPSGHRAAGSAAAAQPLHTQTASTIATGHGQIAIEGLLLRQAATTPIDTFIFLHQRITSAG